MKEIGCRAKLMGTAASTKATTAPLIKANGHTARKTVKELNPGLMEQSMMAPLKTTKNTALEPSTSQMARSIAANLTKV